MGSTHLEVVRLTKGRNTHRFACGIKSPTVWTMKPENVSCVKCLKSKDYRLLVLDYTAMPALKKMDDPASLGGSTKEAKMKKLDGEVGALRDKLRERLYELIDLMEDMEAKKEALDGAIEELSREW
jgi:hypothetical protein